MGDENESENSPALADRPDEWLLSQWKSGDERAAEILFDRYAMRLVALVASRLNQRYRGAIEPVEVVQSALGSFFDAARHSRIRVSSSASLWRLLATFARRKMARSIERHSAAKRGGHADRISLAEAEGQHAGDRDDGASDEAAEFLAAVKDELADDLRELLERLLAGQTQVEIADALSVDERTVRRRLVRIREQLAGVNVAKSREREEALTRSTTETNASLPRVGYREFVLGKLIGSGGFGKVYRATMQSDGSTVAVKFLRKAFWQNESARQSFLREIESASQINHPGVMRYLGYGESPHGGPYVISEWIDGESLSSVGRVSDRRLTGWLRQICGAMEAVHQAGLVHGDLTPGNVLVDSQDRITITDFGFAQAFAGANSPILGDPLVLGGTMGFAAPEQIDPAFGEISAKTDLYAIGGLIHWFLFQCPPNAGQSIEVALAETLSLQDVDRLDFAAMPNPFREILTNTLRKSPADRSMGISDIIRMLDSPTDRER